MKNIKNYHAQLWGWFTIFKKICLGLVILFSLTGCKEKTNHHYPLEIKDNEISQSNKNERQKEFQIDGLYEVKRDCFMYDKIDPLRKWDEIKKGSSVKILSNEKDNFVRVDYFGNQAYMKKEDLDIES